MEPDANSSYTRRLSGRAISRRWGVITLLTLVGLGLGALAVSTQPRSFESTATVLVEPIIGSPFSPTPLGQDLLNLETEAAIVGSTAVSELVLDEGNFDQTADELALNVQATPLENTQILEIRFVAGNASDAQRGAQAFATEYLEFREDNAAQQTEDLTSNLQEAAQANQEAIALATVELEEATPNTLDAVVARGRLQAAVAAQTDLDTQLEQALLYQTYPGRVLSPAEEGRTAGLSPAMLLAGAGIAGLILGLAAAVGLAWRDTRLRGPEDVQRMDLEVLARVPAPTLITLDDAVASRFEGQPGPEVQRLRAVLTGQVRGRRSLVCFVSVSGDGSQDDLVASVATAAMSAGVRVSMGSVGSGRPRYFPAMRNEQAATGQPGLPAQGAEQTELVLLSGSGMDDFRTLDLLASADLLVLVADEGRSTDSDVQRALEYAETVNTPVAGIVLVHGSSRRAARSANPRNAPPDPGIDVDTGEGRAVGASQRPT
jgi:capsular polysaccharide biosynthesis protein